MRRVRGSSNTPERQPVQRSGPGLGSYMAAGAAMGVGSEVAHQAIRGLFSSGSGNPGGVGRPAGPCDQYVETLLSCIYQSPQDITQCQLLVNQRPRGC